MTLQNGKLEKAWYVHKKKEAMETQTWELEQTDLLSMQLLWQSLLTSVRS